MKLLVSLIASAQLEVVISLKIKRSDMTVNFATSRVNQNVIFN